MRHILLIVGSIVRSVFLFLQSVGSCRVCRGAVMDLNSWTTQKLLWKHTFKALKRKHNFQNYSHLPVLDIHYVRVQWDQLEHKLKSALRKGRVLSACRSRTEQPPPVCPHQFYNSQIPSPLNQWKMTHPSNYYVLSEQCSRLWVKTGCRIGLRHQKA